MRSKINRRALIARINRRLATEGRMLRASRSEADRAAMGDYFVIDLKADRIVSSNADPVALAKSLGLLRAFEQVTED